MRTNNLKRDQQGFTISSLLMVIIFVLLIFFVGKYISKTNQDNKEQAGKLQQALVGEDSPEPDEDDDVIPSTPDSEAWEYPIKNVSVDIQALHVVFTAQLPGTYIGTCTVEINQPNGDNPYRFVEPLNSTKSCTVTIPRNKLDDGKRWQYVMGFFSKDGRSWGKHPEGSLSL